jgi:Isochorismatase family
MSLLSREHAALVVVDVQEAFRGYACFGGVASSCAKLVKGARILGLPAVISEQYPKGLGHTAPELGLEDEPLIEKSVFSAARAEGFDRWLAEMGTDWGDTGSARLPQSAGAEGAGLPASAGPHGRPQALVCGIETHVCVSQTVHDLLGQGIEVHVPADAVGSRHALDYERGLERMERAGAVITTVEAALFELLERAGTPEFKQVQKLIF